MAERVLFGFVGFGEVGFGLAKGMRAAGAGPMKVYDKNANTGTLAATITNRAQEAGVSLTDPSGLCDRNIILSVVTPGSALEAASAYRPFAKAGQFYVDLNSSHPMMKKQIDALFSSTGIRFVDGSMGGGGIKLDGHRLPIYLSGPDAEEVAKLMASYDLNVKVLGNQVGMASSLKMLRGVTMKGLEALLVEMLAAAQEFNVAEEVLGSVADALEGKRFRDFANMLVTTHLIHCGRRGEELEMIRESVMAAGIEPVMTDAALALFRRSASLGLEEVFHGEAPARFQHGLQVMTQRLRKKG